MYVLNRDVVVEFRAACGGGGRRTDLEERRSRMEGWAGREAEPGDGRGVGVYGRGSRLGKRIYEPGAAA